MLNEDAGGFWRLFDTVRSAQPAAVEESLRRRVFEAARALARGDYGPARAVVAEV